MTEGVGVAGTRAAVQGTVENGVDHGVPLRAAARDRALGDGRAVKRLHEVLKAAGETPST